MLENQGDKVTAWNSANYFIEPNDVRMVAPFQYFDFNRIAAAFADVGI